MNKIRIKQIESGEFQGLIESLATGVVQRASGDIVAQIARPSFHVSLASGVDNFSYSYGSTITGYPVLTIGSSGVSDPIILGFPTGILPTGVKVALSAPTVSNKYFANILL